MIRHNCVLALMRRLRGAWPIANLSSGFDLFRRQRAAIAGARVAVSAAGLDVAAVRLALAGTVVQTYLDQRGSEMNSMSRLRQGDGRPAIGVEAGGVAVARAASFAMSMTCRLLS